MNLPVPLRCRSHRSGAAAMAAAIALTAGACSSSSSGAGVADGPTGTITVLAASSLTGTFTTLGHDFEQAHPGTTVKFSFGASSTLAQQALAGAPADMFAAASPKTMLTVSSAGLARAVTTFARNQAEIAVAPAKATTITALADLAKPGVKVALCQPQVPCGSVAAKVLTNAHLTVKPVTEGLDVKSTLAYVTSGEADAAIVYVTDVKAAGSAVVGVSIPTADNADTSYQITVLTGSHNTTLAQAFLAYVLSSTGQQVLTGAGFLSP